MFTEFGPAPLCLELDFDSFDGPPHWVARLRKKSGWLMVAKATIQSEHDILTDKLVVACDEQETPIPSFKAVNLIHCGWINPTYCDELPPHILEDLICEEEGALIARWHREKNTALAEAFEDQEARIAELEGRVRSMIEHNELEIAELRQRRRHPDATPDLRLAMREIIAELDAENDELLAEMAETRATIREQSAELEESLWARDDLLVEVTPLHVVRWSAKSRAYSDLPARPKQYSTLWVPACGPTGGSTPKFENMEEQIAAGLAKTAAAKSVKDVVAVAPRPGLPKHSPALRKIASSPPDNAPETAVTENTGWTHKRVELLKSMWLAGEFAATIAAALGNTSRNAVINKAQRLGLPRTRGPEAGSPQAASMPTANTVEQSTDQSTETEKRWTAERLEVLRRMWAAGCGADEIGEALGGLPRNAVIGKAFRLGLGSQTEMTVQSGAKDPEQEAGYGTSVLAPSQQAVVDNLARLRAARKKYYKQEI